MAYDPRDVAEHAESLLAVVFTRVPQARLITAPAKFPGIDYIVQFSNTYPISDQRQLGVKLHPTTRSTKLIDRHGRLNRRLSNQARADTFPYPMPVALVLIDVLTDAVYISWPLSLPANQGTAAPDEAGLPLTQLTRENMHIVMTAVDAWYRSDAIEADSESKHHQHAV